MALNFLSSKSNRKFPGSILSRIAERTSRLRRLSSAAYPELKRLKVRGGEIADATDARMAASAKIGVCLIRKSKPSSTTAGARMRTSQAPCARGGVVDNSQ